jgi:hypothetical protein
MSSERSFEGKHVIDNHKMAILSDTGKQKSGRVLLDLEVNLYYFEFTKHCELFLSEATILCIL